MGIKEIFLDLVIKFIDGRFATGLYRRLRIATSVNIMIRAMLHKSKNQ